MSATPVLSALYRYPVKSMRGESLAASPVGPAGLPYDRTWMVADENGRFVTGRTHPELVLVAARPGPGGVTLSAPGRDDLFVPDDAFTEPCPTIVWGSEFPAWRGATAADAWISAYLGTRLRFMWIGADTARRVKTAPDVPLTFADGFPLLLIGQASLAQVLDQLDYGVKLVGIDHVGIGSDFDGVGGELAEGLRTVADFPNLVAGLQARGYDDAGIGKILGGNLLRTWARIEAGAVPQD